MSQRRMSKEKSRRVGLLLKRIFAVTVVLYVLLGAVLVYQAYAQETQSAIFPVPGKQLNMKIPTGSDDATVKQYYDYLALRHVGTLEETYQLNYYYLGTVYLVIGVVLIVFYFLTYSWYSRTRHQGDLYPVEVYNAYITERGGPIDSFNWATYAILLSYMVYYTVINLMFAQYY